MSAHQSVGHIQPVILCGGSGTRLWPRSRASRPKPFLPLLGERTLFEATLDRVAGGDLFAAPIVVAGGAHVDYIMAQASDTTTVIVEPEGRNTAPAIGLAAALMAGSQQGDAVMLVLPSDHYIADTDAFIAAAQQAAALASEGRMVALGIAPNRPETGYGYIKRGEPLDVGFAVDRFVEKPDRANAEQFLAEGGYFWNGGIFAFRADEYLRELERYRPDMMQLVRAAAHKHDLDGRCIRPDAASFVEIRGESVDYAVMEHTERAAVVPVDMGWSDIGNWDALRDARGVEADGEGNIVRGSAELADCRGVMVDSDGPHVSVIGLEDVVVVVDGDKVLVTSTDGAQQVGKLRGAAEQ